MTDWMTSMNEEIERKFGDKLPCSLCGMTDCGHHDMYSQESRAASDRLDYMQETDLRMRDIARAVKLDYVMTQEEVTASWRDEFLTNVMVPYLEHIKDEVRDRQIQMLSRISQQGHPVTDEQTEAYKSLVHDANSLTQIIHILKEWRG